jgi:hypothetical protein
VLLRRLLDRAGATFQRAVTLGQLLPASGSRTPSDGVNRASRDGAHAHVAEALAEAWDGCVARCC